MKALALLVGVAMVACRTEQHREPPAAPSRSAIAPASPASAAEELDRLDQRQPLPLLPMMANHQKQNMREHLTVVQQVVAATATRDFAQVAQAAQRIGYSETMGQMCEHMGAGAPGFTEQALAFHHSADRIVDAAKREDSAAVLGALGETLATCTACHAAYKQKLVGRLP
jgi:hypothetical protein